MDMDILNVSIDEILNEGEIDESINEEVIEKKDDLESTKADD